MRYLRHAGMCVAVGLLLLPAAQAFALSVGPQAPMPAGTVLFDPARFTSADLEAFEGLFAGQSLGFYHRPAAAPADLPEWTLLETLESVFDDHVTGVLRSQAWQHQDGHILLAYQLSNTGEVAMSGLKFTIHTAPLEILDAGVLGDGVDIQHMSRMAADMNDEIAFKIAYSEPLEMHSGESTSWVYIETNGQTYHTGLTTVQNHTASADNVPLLVPCPEPMTVLAVGLSLAGLGGYVVRRRKLA